MLESEKKRTPYNCEAHMEGTVDFSKVDVISMASETGIPTRKIYDVLQLPYDSTLQGYMDAAKIASVAGVDQDWAKAMMDLEHYEGRVTSDRGLLSTHIRTFAPGSEEDREVKEKVREMMESGEELPTPQNLLRGFLAITVEETGIPWGSQEQKDAIKERASLIDNLPELLKLYKEIPIPADERDIVIRAMAVFFIQR